MSCRWAQDRIGMPHPCSAMEQESPDGFSDNSPGCGGCRGMLLSTGLQRHGWEAAAGTSSCLELMGMLKPWQSWVHHQCHHNWKWPNLYCDGKRGWFSHAGWCGGKLSSSGSLNTCTYV